MAASKKKLGRPAASKKKLGRPAGSKNKKPNNTNSKEKIEEMQQKRKNEKRLIDEIWAVTCIAIGIFFVAATQFNATGEFGNMIGEFLKGTFGFIALVLPWYIICFGIMLFSQKTLHISGKMIIFLFVILLMFCLLNSERFIDVKNLNIAFSDIGIYYSTGIKLDSGGAFGMTVGTLLVKAIGKYGLTIFAIVIIIVCILLTINTPIAKIIEKEKYKRETNKLLKEEKDAAELLQRSGQNDKEPSLYEKASSNIKNKQMKIEDIPKFDDAKNIKIFNTEEEIDATDDKLNGNNNGSSYDSSSELKDSKNNILKYMKDKSLFEPSKQNLSGNSIGLEPASDFGDGYGIGGVIACAGNAVLSNKEAKEAMPLPSEFLEHKKTGKYQKPPIELLMKAEVINTNEINTGLKEKAEKLEETLKNFHVDARVVQVTQGPAITRYEIQPNVGVKVSSIVRLADDIALNLEAKSIRIEAPIPGKAAVGIEVENERINMVTLREIITSKEYKNAKSKITFAVGKDIAGKAIVANLKDMPHLLIAGSTGSGKSVCINSIITSILYKANPDEVKLVLIDPKVVELGNYNGIPHLLIPVVTDPSKAAAALNWAVAEMNERYKKFAEEGVRDLESFNESVLANDEKERVTPQIVIIIDELADLMMAAPSQVEESICRLAQMARAAGMHLIVATQRPSVDIITGVIKANIPSRVAFAVSSQFDSRTILDMGGAEKLVGKGDMLFNPLGMGKPIRVQGAYISNSEVHKVIDFVKSQVDEVNYSKDILHTIEKGKSASTANDEDEILSQAIECVVQSGQASVSMLQRRFRIGYNRAARIVDMMEARGIVSAADGSRPRNVLITEEELLEMKNINEGE